MPPHLKKLKYRAWHRGFVEADLVLGPFADAHLEILDAAELEQFGALLDQPDHDLYAWIIGQAEPPEAFDLPVLGRIRQYCLAGRLVRPGVGA